METSSQNLYDRLSALARNLWWSWYPEVGDLFHELDPVRWREVGHNPVALLTAFTPESLEKRADELLLHNRIHYAYRRMREYLRSDMTWASTHAGPLLVRPVAYFSAEFGLHESLPIYSGGLGVLAGDHLKSASDLGVPLVGVGLLYNQGYFHQRLESNGRQVEDYTDADVSMLPIEPALDTQGKPIQLSIATAAGELRACVWRVQVGRVTLYLLDSDVEGNPPEFRELTARLYGGDLRVRIRQELLLGVGGVRALIAAGIRPGVIHMNEGHSAFAALELIRQRMVDQAISFEEARHEVASLTVFTTHTPVPAGHDCFPAELIEEHLGELRKDLGLTEDELMGLGRIDKTDEDEMFGMTVLALTASHHSNAVSALHGRVSRKMWMPFWPGQPEEHVPIGHITNGVHVFSWLSPQMRRLYDRHFAVNWPLVTAEPETWSNIENVHAADLWETHQSLKLHLINFVRQRAVLQAERRGESAETLDALSKVLRFDALLIGFARRFATYKRANLVVRDIERLANLINHSTRPIQLVFAGKAHPRDEEGKHVLQEIAQLTRDPRFAGKVVFVEDYDINVGRHLVQGVDVWLNNPRRPLEASGTSGQKVVLNGGLNLSILDGWWAEAYDGQNGFAIGRGDMHRSWEVQDRLDAEALYRVLETEVIPMYYTRDVDGLPREWVARMKRGIRTLGWRFNADRMVMDYVHRCYMPAAGAVSCEFP